jgi:hypothetical protein
MAKICRPGIGDNPYRPLAQVGTSKPKCRYGAGHSNGGIKIRPGIVDFLKEYAYGDEAEIEYGET